MQASTNCSRFRLLEFPGRRKGDRVRVAQRFQRVFVAAQFPFVKDALQINPVKDDVLEVDIDDLKRGHLLTEVTRKTRDEMLSHQ